MLAYNDWPNKPLNLMYCAYAPDFMDVRIQQPIQAMQMHGANVRLVEKQISFMNDIIPGAPKIMVIQRCMGDPVEWPAALRRIIAEGWLVVVERDDYPLSPVKSSKPRWEKSMKWEAFSACHAVQTSTERLRDLFSRYNPEVNVIANQLGQVPTNMTRNSKRVRVFFGALNRREAWLPLMDTFNKVLARHKNIQPIVLFDKAFFEALDHPAKAYRPRLAYSDYMRCLQSCDIALLPLNDSEFTRHKSDVKFVECGGARTAVIASPVVYSDTVDHGRTGLIADTPAEWEAALDRLISDSAYRQSLAMGAFEYVLKNRMQADHITAQINWYYDLWSRREALTEALYERYPSCRPA
ncbi:glycosyltransferase family protein [Kordiimonas lacus]|uniref:Glycosyl transferases group 1 n=1 Tax=Kordiimonas lacus TaxID=637679 RepID=A0A1G7AYS5_9PROT|nr:glycosyltransferase [Kordiimonas lacus]SDE19810.1 Glycosyl transferases group 1 [Kordiimonas lacus]